MKLLLFLLLSTFLHAQWWKIEYEPVTMLHVFEVRPLLSIAYINDEKYNIFTAIEKLTEVSDKILDENKMPFDDGSGFYYTGPYLDGKLISISKTNSPILDEDEKKWTEVYEAEYGVLNLFTGEMVSTQLVFTDSLEAAFKLASNEAYFRSIEKGVGSIYREES